MQVAFYYNIYIRVNECQKQEQKPTDRFGARERKTRKRRKSNVYSICSSGRRRTFVFADSLIRNPSDSSPVTFAFERPSHKTLFRRQFAFRERGHPRLICFPYHVFYMCDIVRTTVLRASGLYDVRSISAYFVSVKRTI